MNPRLKQMELVPCKRGNVLFAKVVAHNRQCETFCCKFHIWLRTYQVEDFENIGILAVMATLPQLLRQVALIVKLKEKNSMFFNILNR